MSEVMQNSFIKRISEKVITVIPMNGEGDILLWFFKVKSETAGVIRDNRQPKSLNFLEITDLRDCRV